MTFALLDIFQHRIDPILKLTHIPSLRTLLLGGPTFLSGQEALKFAVYFTAVCSLEENECLEIIGEEKSKTVATFRLGTEVLLSRASLLTTTDLTTLQAFILYLVQLSARTANLTSCRLDSEHAVEVAQSGP